MFECEASVHRKRQENRACTGAPAFHEKLYKLTKDKCCVNTRKYRHSQSEMKCDHSIVWQFAHHVLLELSFKGVGIWVPKGLQIH